MCLSRARPCGLLRPARDSSARAAKCVKGLGLAKAPTIKEGPGATSSPSRGTRKPDIHTHTHKYKAQAWTPSHRFVPQTEHGAASRIKSSKAEPVVRCNLAGRKQKGATNMLGQPWLRTPNHRGRLSICRLHTYGAAQDLLSLSNKPITMQHRSS